MTAARVIGWLLALLALGLANDARACDAFWKAGSDPQDCYDCSCGRSGSVSFAAFSCVAKPSKKDCTTCHDARNGADCDHDGYTVYEESRLGTDPLVQDADDCALGRDDCSDLAECTDDVSQRGHFTCTCPAGYGGDGRGPGGCIDDDECDAEVDPCSVFQPGNPQCKNVPGGYLCPCQPPYFGDGKTGCTLDNTCAIDPPPCSPLSECLPKAGAADCGACPAGYRGDGKGPNGCQDVPECDQDPSPCKPLTQCIEKVGGFDCSPCPSGYSGNGFDGCVAPVTCQGVACAEHAHCEGDRASSDGGASAIDVGACVCDPGFELDADRECQDVDECQDDDVCAAGTTCQNTLGHYQCRCPSGRVTGADGLCAEPENEPTPGQGGAAPGSGNEAGNPAGGVAQRPRTSSDSSGCSTAPGRPGAGGLLALACLLLAFGQRRRRGLRRLSWLLLLPIAVMGGCNPTRHIDVNGAEAGAGGAPDVVKPQPHAGQAGAAPETVECRHSRDCAVDEWCNPAGSVCESRRQRSAATFEQITELFRIEGCPACHHPKGSGAVDATESGTIALLIGDDADVYRTLIAGGVNCGTEQHRLCIDDPKSSLLIEKLRENPAIPLEQQPSAIYPSWDMPKLQALMRWIAGGATYGHPEPACGNFIIEAGEECDLGPTPAEACGYGQASCSLCTVDCKIVDGTGPVCGDGVVNAPHEACDQPTLTDEIGPLGGAVCENCRFRAGTLCGGTGLDCCKAYEPGCDAASYCGEDDKCHGCGKADQDCCTDDACNEGLVCRLQGAPGVPAEKLCRPACGEESEACCQHDGVKNWCNPGQICDLAASGGPTCKPCGGHDHYAWYDFEACCPGVLPGQEYCNDEFGGFDYVCNDEHLCEPCGEIGQRCCDSGGGCPYPGMCDGYMCVPHPCGRENEMCCDGIFCDDGFECNSVQSCERCGGPGEMCCYNGCFSNATCDENNQCQTCGDGGEPCCDDNSCLWGDCVEATNTCPYY